MKAIKEATYEELTETGGLTPKVAENVLEFFAAGDGDLDK